MNTECPSCHKLTIDSASKDKYCLQCNWIEDETYKRVLAGLGEKQRIVLVPDDIYDDFLNLLDAAQCSLTQDDVNKLCESEQKCLEFVEKLLGNRTSQRWATQKEAKDAAETFKNALG